MKNRNHFSVKMVLQMHFHTKDEKTADLIHDMKQRGAQLIYQITDLSLQNENYRVNLVLEFILQNKNISRYQYSA